MFFLISQALTFSIRVNYKKHRKVASIAIAIELFSAFIGIVFWIIICNIKQTENPQLFSIAICCIYIKICYYIIQFVLVSEALGSRFRALSGCFENSPHFDGVKCVQERSNFENSKKYIRLFNKLCDCLEMCNETFTFHFVLQFPVFLVKLLRAITAFYLSKNSKFQVSVIFLMFGAITLIMNETFTNVTLLHIFVNFMFTFNYTAMIMSTVYSGNRTKKAAKQLKIQLFKSVTKKFLNENQCEQMISSLMQVSSRNLSLRNDFFKIDWKVFINVSHQILKICTWDLFIIFSVYFCFDSQFIATISTYLVILCQFEFQHVSKI